MTRPKVKYLVENTSPEPNTGCWLWMGGYKNNGYGPHREFYIKFKGPVPKGMHLDHLCLVKACVNPDHLEIVTPKENSRRARLQHPRKTACKYGHSYESAYSRPDGLGFNCRICGARNARRYLERKRCGS